MTNQATLELEDFPATPHENGHWLRDDGRMFFIWPARNPKTNERVEVQVEVTSISHDDVPGQLKPSRKSIEAAARELYLPGASAVRLMRPDAYWMQRGH